MQQDQISDLVRLVPDHRLADFAAETLRQGCDGTRPMRRQIDDLLLALACIERLIVLAWTSDDDAGQMLPPSRSQRPEAY